MKKLLSLFSVLTITGIAMPNVIAARNYEKEEKLNSNINYQTTNILEILERNKRGIIFKTDGQTVFNINNFYPVKNIFVPSASFGITGNNSPSNREIFDGIYAANNLTYLNLNNNFCFENYIRNCPNPSNFLGIKYASKHSAYVYAKPNTAFTGGFWVYY